MDDSITEVSLVPHVTWSEPTANLKFIDGKLHQAFRDHYSDGDLFIAWRPVPSESSPGAAQSEDPS